MADAHWRLGPAPTLVGRPPDESLDVAALSRRSLWRPSEWDIVRPGRYAVRLAACHDRSGGETRRVNRDLIVANAGLAAEIVVADAAL